MSRGFTLREDKRRPMLPKMPRRSQRLLNKTHRLGTCHILYWYDSVIWNHKMALRTHTHFSFFPEVTAATQTQKWRRHCSYLFPCLSWRQSRQQWCGGPQEKQLNDQNSQKYQLNRDPSSSDSEWSKCVPTSLFKSRKNGSAFCFLPPPSKHISSFFLAKYNGKQF